MSSDLVDGQELTTLLGDTLVVSVAEGVVTKINGAAIVAADVEAKNGVVHAIDAVLLPPPPETVVEVISSSPEFLTLVAAVEAASLAEPLSTPGPFTVFAPSNLAFAADLSALNLTAEELLGRGDLSEILMYHVVPGKVRSAVVSTSIEGHWDWASQSKEAPFRPSALVSSFRICFDKRS